MKKFVSWLLVVALTAALAVGGTMAYLTDTDEDINVMTVGRVRIDQLEYERVDTETKNDDAIVQEFHDNKPLYPAVTDEGFDWTTDPSVDWGQIGKDGYSSNIWDPEKINNEMDKMVFVKNKGDFDAYVRSVFAFEANGYTLDQFKELFRLNINETDWTWEWEEDPVSINGENGVTNYIIATATYNKPLKPGEITEISLSQIALDPSAGNADILGFGDTYQVLVKTQAIQTEGFDDPKIALTEGFGDVSTVPGEIMIPFENDNPIQGIDLRTALHNLNGDTTQVITAKVNKVTFGLNKDYPDIADRFEGTLVDIEQDVKVYAYYVPDGSNYNVYFLADDDIYLPKDSSRLFQDMAALTDVQTYNLNTSRAELMNHLFFRCSKLANIDVSGFDTGKATNMKSMFNACSSLESVDVSKWDTSNVKNMSYMFRTCTAMEEIDVSNLDVSNVENMEYMFSFSENLKKINTTGWDTRSVKTTRGMFMNCFSLEELPGSDGWQLLSNTDMYYMFQNCYPLEYLDVSKWNCSNVTTMQGTFYQCQGLKTVDGLGNWDTSKVTTFSAFMNNCKSLESVDGIGNFDTGNAEIMSHMFWNCCSLKEVDVANWNTGKVTAFNSMFSGAGHNTGEMLFTRLEIENWDVSSATNMEYMFYGCGNLTELDLSKWNPCNVTSFRHIFADCFKLKSIDFTGWDTSSVISFDGMFNDCISLEYLDVSDFDTGTATNFAQFFEGCQGLKTVVGMDKWDTSNVTTMYEMFNYNGKNMQLEYVDLSSFDTSSLTDTYAMFNGCKNLTTIYVGDAWDMSKVTSSSAMFGSCPKLVGGNGTKLAELKTADKTYACVDAEGVPGYLTHINDKPAEG